MRPGSSLRFQPLPPSETPHAAPDNPLAPPNGRARPAPSFEVAVGAISQRLSPNRQPSRFFVLSWRAGTPPSRPGRKAHICCLSGGTDGVSPEGPQRSIHVSSLWIEGSSVDPIGGRNSRRLCRRIEAALSRFWTRVDREIVVVAGASSDQQLLRVLASVKARRCAPPPLRGAHGLDAGSVRIPDEVERRFRTKWEHRFRRKWNIDSGKWNTDSGMWNVDSGRSGTSAPGIVNARR